MSDIIDAVRACAAAKMTMREAAIQLNKTRNAIAGLAHKNGIVFDGVVTPYQRVQRAKPSKTPPYIPKPRTPSAALVKRNGTTRMVKAPELRCSWHGCTRESEPEDMFCRSHAKRGLFG